MANQLVAYILTLFDTREYKIEFTDGTREKYQASIIAENMYAQVDSKDNQYLLLHEITDHRSDNSLIPISKGMVLLVQWRDGSVSWEKLADLKVSNPVEVTEYAVVNWLIEEPAFKWWVPHVIHQRNRIISKAKS